MPRAQKGTHRMSDDGIVELADAIGVIRDQLAEAQHASRQFDDERALTFEVGKVVVELSGEVKTSLGAEGGTRFWVLTAQASAERAHSALHKVQVELIPQTSDGKTVRVADDIHALPKD